MKKRWLLGCCLVLALPGYGQGRDTVLAVHKLFRQQRPKDAQVATAGAGPLLVNSSPIAERVTTAAVGAGVSAAVAAWQNRRFSAERETLILQQYGQGVPIPADIRRRLRGKLFRRTAQDVRNGF